MTTIDDIPADVLCDVGDALQLRIDRRGESSALGTLLSRVLERTPMALRRSGRSDESVHVRSVHLDASGDALHAWVAPAPAAKVRRRDVAVPSAA